MHTLESVLAHDPSRITRHIYSSAGFGLIEVMIAMFILICALLGVMGVFQWADVGFWEALRADRALSAAEVRLEAKRTMPWNMLLSDDLDGDGESEVRMRDDGVPPDEQAEDRIFTAGTERDGVRVVWTVQLDRMGREAGASLARVGSAVITSRAIYRAGVGHWREIKLVTVRANPNYVGPR